MFVEDLIVYSSCLENPRDGGAWWVSVYEVAQSWTRSQQLSSSSSRILLPPLSFFGIHDSAFVYGKNLGSIETVTSWDTFLWHGNPLKYSCPDNPMDWGTWGATKHACKGTDYPYSTCTCNVYFIAWYRAGNIKYWLNFKWIEGSRSLDSKAWVSLSLKRWRK